MRLRALLPALLLGICLPSAALAAPAHTGRVGGLVVAEGTPQLGASVIVTPQGRPGTAVRLLTNQRGEFASTALQPGAYSVRVLLAGFWPAFRSRILVSAGQITLLHIEMGSLFSSVERLRQGPADSRVPGEWKWVLRSASIQRPVLRFSHGRVMIAGDAGRDAHASHGRAVLTAGSLTAWSPSDPQPLASTAFLYDHAFSPVSQLLIAGRVGYQHAAASAVAVTWNRSADAQGDTTDSTTVIFRESEFDPEGPSFRGFAIHSVHKMKLSSRAELDYGGEFVTASMAGSASSVQPEAMLKLTIDPAWTATFVLGSSPVSADSSDQGDAMDAFPTPVENQGRLALDRPWHEEMEIGRRMKDRGALSAAIFHDSDVNTAIFGRGSLLDANTIADPYSDALVYDGGALREWGARLGYEENLSSRWQAALVYSWSRALAPGKADPAAASLRDMIGAKRRDSLAARISGRLERTNTELSVSYQWIDGSVLTRPDPFGEALFGVDPYWDVSVRQPLPNFLCCRIVAIVDVRNLLAQGNVGMQTADGRAVLSPAARTIRGGFAVQF
jgi:Carboxypeptidase regulatory-like domain